MIQLPSARPIIENAEKFHTPEFFQPANSTTAARAALSGPRRRAKWIGASHDADKRRHRHDPTAAIKSVTNYSRNQAPKVIFSTTETVKSATFPARPRKEN